MESFKKYIKERDEFVSKRCPLDIVPPSYLRTQIEHQDRMKIAYNAALRSSAVRELITSLEMYAITSETFPEYGDVARKSLANFNEILKWIENE